MSYSWGAEVAPARTDGQPVVAAAAPVRPRRVRPRRVRPGPVRPAPVRPASGGLGTDLRRLAAELAPMVDVWERLLHQHVPDGAGRCRTCTKGGTGVPSASWPCSLHGVADLARRCYAGEAC